MDKQELKPCPFCGSKNIKTDDDGQWNWIVCKACGAKSGFGRDDEGPDFDQWNKRPDLAEDSRKLKQQIADLQSYGCFVKDEAGTICLIAEDNQKLVKALEKIMSYTRLGVGSISRIREIVGEALTKYKEQK